MVTFSRLNRRQILSAGAAFGATMAMGGGQAGAQAGTFRFGLAMPLTGPQALYGADQIQAAQWGVADINAAGGVNGKKLDMIVLDTQADPNVGIQAMNRLINVDKVPVYITAWSAVVKAAAPLANDSKTLQIVVGANAPSISKLGDYVYTSYPLADVDLIALLKYMYGEGKKTAGVLYVNNETGISAAEIYRDAFTAMGGKIVAYEAFDPKATDFTGPILKARASGADMIHIQGQVSDTPQIIAQMRQLGIKQTISSYSAIFHPKFIQSLGAAAEGVVVTSLAPSPEVSADVAKYVQRWVKEKGREPNGLPYTQYLYDAPYLVAKIFEKLDKDGTAITGTSMRQAMLDIKTFHLPLTGQVDILPDHTVKKPVDLMQVKGGKWERITTIGT